MSNEIVPFIDEGSLGTMIKFVDHLKANNALPQNENPGQLLMKLQAAKDMGLTPTQAINGIGFVNGKLTVYGSSAASLMTKHGYALEWLESSATTAKVRVSKGERAHEETYTIEDARKANLANKPGPWSQYPKDMLRWKALSRARNFFCPEVAGGMPVHEDYQDIDEEESNSAKAELLARIAVADDLAPFSKQAARDKDVFEAVAKRRKALAARPAEIADAPAAVPAEVPAAPKAAKKRKEEAKEVEAQIIEEPLPERKATADDAPSEPEAAAVVAEMNEKAIPAADSVFQIPGSRLESVVAAERKEGKRAKPSLLNVINAQWFSPELPEEARAKRTQEAMDKSVIHYTGREKGDIYQLTPTEGEMILSAIMLRNAQLTGRA